MFFGGIEAGGTKFICAVSDESQQIVAKVRISTEAPDKVLQNIFKFFGQYKLVSLGVGAFGPIGINATKADYGYVKQTPKRGWSNFNFLGELKAHFNIPVYWTTDVNVAAYGEYKQGAARNIDHAVYLTVGTGIGGSIINEGKIYQAATHPEIGHIMLEIAEHDDFKGICPYHGRCFEGLASGPAIEARAGIKAALLPEDSEFWKLEAFYLAQAAVNYTLLFSPDIIIFGGGVSNQSHLFTLVRQSFKRQLGGYVDTPDLDDYLVHATLGDSAGITGALLLAQKITA